MVKFISHASLVWGIAGVDDSEVDPNDMESVGTPVFDSSFDGAALLESPAAQQAMFDTALAATKINGVFLQGSKGTTYRTNHCPILHFAEWSQKKKLPFPTNSSLQFFMYIKQNQWMVGDRITLSKVTYYFMQRPEQLFPSI